MNRKTQILLFCCVAAFSLGLLGRPLIETLLFQDPLRPSGMMGKYERLFPPGYVTYELAANGRVDCTSHAPLNPYPHKSLGLWHMVEPNICFVTLRRMHTVAGPTYDSFYLRTDLSRSDVILFSSLEDARKATGTK